MDSFRKWFYRPKRDDKSLLAQFFYADEALNIIASELDSFDGRKDPSRCTTLVNQLRQSQDKVLTITSAIMDVLIGDERANRDFRVKFPEDVLQENLAGQLWFGAECLAAGSSIMNKEAESASMRPLAKAVTKSLENVRNLLRDTCLHNNVPNGPIRLDSNELFTEMLLESLKIFDRLFAEFELEYVSAMVPVKSTQEYELQEVIAVLFSETLQRALKMRLLSQDMVDDCDPALMFTIPRLAIVSGLLIFPGGPLCIDKSLDDMSGMFRPFRTLLHKIRELLWTLDKRELYMLEKLLCDNEQYSDDVRSVSEVHVGDLDRFFNEFYSDCKHHLTNNNNTNNVDKNTTKSAPKSGTSSPTYSRPQEASYAATNSVDIPSTSGYLIPNSIAHDIIVASMVPSHPAEHAESPSDTDSLEVISAAAANLSSILTTDSAKSSPCKKIASLESPNDSGICTENTSLDRSPTLECQCVSNKNSPRHVRQRPEFSPGTSSNKILQICTLSVRRRNKISKRETLIDDDSSSVGSSDTSSFNSNCADDEEIALAMQAAQIAKGNEIRAKYESSEDLIHRLFVCIAGVADQLQTNFASDLRNILKSVFLMNTSNSDPSLKVDCSSLDTSLEYRPSEDEVIENNEFSVDPNILAQEALFDTNVYFHLDTRENGENDEYSNHPRQDNQSEDRNLAFDLDRYVSLREDIANLHGSLPAPAIPHNGPEIQHYEDIQRPPIWIPDVEAPRCMSCGMNFTVVKRRHHCRNCGKVFCGRCSSNSVPLPKFGHHKPVRVCNRCFIYNLTPFTM